MLLHMKIGSTSNIFVLSHDSTHLYTQQHVSEEYSLPANRGFSEVDSFAVSLDVCVYCKCTSVNRLLWGRTQQADITDSFSSMLWRE